MKISNKKIMLMNCCLFQNLNNNINSSTNDTFGYNSSLLGVKPLSPSVTPIKPLPFSPSQFLNSPILTFDMTLPASTPVRKRFQKVTFFFFIFFYSYMKLFKCKCLPSHIVATSNYYFF